MIDSGYFPLKNVMLGFVQQGNTVYTKAHTTCQLTLDVATTTPVMVCSQTAILDGSMQLDELM